MKNRGEPKNTPDETKSIPIEQFHQRADTWENPPRLTQEEFIEAT
jgi:hypothetical protein